MGEENQGVGEAIVLRSSGTIMGLSFMAVSGSNWAWAGSVPIAGRVMLDWVMIMSRLITGYMGLVSLDLRVASEVPTSVMDVRAADPLFPHASTVWDYRTFLHFAAPYFAYQLPVGKLIAMEGRRLIGAVFNPTIQQADIHVYFGLHGVEGGEGGPGIGFLAGEWLGER